MTGVKTSKPGYYGKGSVEVGPDPPAGEGRIRRLAISADKLVTQPFEGIDTVLDVISYTARTHGTKPALGWRDVVTIHEEEKEVQKLVDGKQVTEKKKWKYFELSDYKYLSFVDVQEAVSEIGRALVHLGIGKQHIFNVYSQTCVNWQLVSYACACISTTIATAYDTLGESGLTHSINEPECIGIFTNDDLLPTLLTVLPNTPSLKFIIYDGEPKPAVLDKIRGTRDDLKVMSLSELRALGKAQSADILEERKPTPETLACIMYTSGSTGAPKGVCISHANMIASVGGVYTLVGHHFAHDDTYLAYLPLAHILEFLVEMSLFFIGMTTGYGRVKTLTDTSVRNCKGDITTFRPSIMVGVPAVWETIRKGIVGKINAGGAVGKSVFNASIKVKKAGVPILTQVVDSVVLSKVRAATGGRLRIGLSGGAALSKETQEFLSLALVIMLQGYGMTESSGCCAILPPEIMQYGAVGLPVPAIEVKLIDVPEAGYTSQSSPPQGEVCIRGPAVTKGYYKRDDLNKDETIFTKDGWLRTGDVGQWNEDGSITLIDRIKNMIKLQGGEYIALERLESVYKACNYVANMCVHATPDAKQPIAIVVPHEANLRHVIPNHPLTSDVDHKKSLEELCLDPRVVELVLKECNVLGKKNGFKTMEQLQGMILSADEWLPENGLVTAAQKIQRAKIANKYKKEIDDVYAKSE